MRGPTVLIASLLVSMCMASPNLRVIAATVAGSNPQVVAGEPTLRWWPNASAFGRVQGSRDGRWFAFGGIIDDPIDRKQAWCFGEVDEPITWTTPFMEDRPWPLDNSMTIEDNRTSMGVSDTGRIIFGANASGVTTTDDYILAYKDGVYSVIAREGSVAPATGFSFATVMGGCTIDPQSEEAWFHTGANSATANAGIFSESGSGPVVRGVTNVLWAGNPFVVNFLEPDRMRQSEGGSRVFYQARLAAPTTEDSVVIFGTTVVGREGFLLPGEASGALVSTMDSAFGTSTVSPNGASFGFRGSRVGGADFAVFGVSQPTPVSALNIINEGDPVLAGGTELWSGAGSNVFGSQTFQVVAVNSFGDKILGGYTNEPVGQNFVLTLNGTEVLLRSGAPVDLNGNGSFDDDCFFNQVVSDNFVFSENNRVLMGATVRNGAGTVTGISIISFDAPIPGDVNGDGEVGPADFALLAAAFGSFVGDPTYNADADLNRDGEVGPGDFAILARNFGRIR